MRDTEYSCSYCENEFTVLSEAEDTVEFCPFCGEDLLPDDDDDTYPELDFNDEED